jgi:hypothetical protein
MTTFHSTTPIKEKEYIHQVVKRIYYFDFLQIKYSMLTSWDATCPHGLKTCDGRPELRVSSKVNATGTKAPAVRHNGQDLNEFLEEVYYKMWNSQYRYTISSTCMGSINIQHSIPPIERFWKTMNMATRRENVRSSVFRDIKFISKRHAVTIRGTFMHFLHTLFGPDFSLEERHIAELQRVHHDRTLRIQCIEFSDRFWRIFLWSKIYEPIFILISFVQYSNLIPVCYYL